MCWSACRCSWRLALLVALMLDKGMRGLPFYRSVFYLPSLLGCSVAIAILWKQMFGTTGLVNQSAGDVRDPGPGWISDPNTALGTHHPAARVDVRRADDHLPGGPAADPGDVLRGRIGGRRQHAAAVPEDHAADAQSRSSSSIWCSRSSDAFQSFTQAFIVSGGNGGPSDSTMFFTLYLYQKGFGQFDMGYASAMAWVLLVHHRRVHRHQLHLLKVLGVL